MQKMSIGLSIRWIWISFAFINIKERGNYFFGGRAGDLILGNLQQLIHHFHIGMEEDDEEKRKKLREKREPCSFFYCDTFSIEWNIDEPFLFEKRYGKSDGLWWATMESLAFMEDMNNVSKFFVF